MTMAFSTLSQRLASPFRKLSVMVQWKAVRAMSSRDGLRATASPTARTAFHLQRPVNLPRIYQQADQPFADTDIVQPRNHNEYCVLAECGEKWRRSFATIAPSRSLLPAA